MSELPFQAEYAKSGRAGCKGCSKSIDKDSLRLAVMIQSRHFDGQVPNWFHFQCFWSRAKCTKTDDIHGFDNLRWEDQEKIKNMVIGRKAGNSMSAPSSLIAYKDYAVEYAKSSRSKCRGCTDKIEKGVVRISCKDCDSDNAKMYRPLDAWYHVDCFVDKRHELGFTEAMDFSKISGFSNLSTNDKAELVKKIGKGNGTKRKAEAVVPEKTLKRSKNDTEVNLQIQNELIWKIRDNLRGSVSNEALKGLLQYNNQGIVSGESKLLDSVSDAMAFGALKPCPECGGELRLSGSSHGYCCTGNISGWTKCQYTTLLPLRKPFKIPKEYHDVEFLKSYQYVERQRCFPQKEDQGVKNIKEETKILSNIKIGFMGKLGIKQAEATKVIEELGGIISKKKDDPHLILIISTKAELNKQMSKAKLFKEMEIPVVSERFIEDVKNTENEDLMSIINKYLISDWDCNVGKKLNEVSSNLKKSSNLKVKQKMDCMFTKDVPSKVKVSVKGGAAVDPDSGLVDVCHVLKGDNKTDIFSVVLGLVDVLKGTNSFYKLQLLEGDIEKRWWLFRSWGRVGTSIGGNKLENFSSKVDAIDAFKDLYKEKTGNFWDCRANIVKIPNKFYPLDIDYGVEKAEARHLNSLESKSKLPKQIRELIQLIFDVENMKQAMLEFEIDLKKMPLGKLSKKQIENAYKVLAELQMMVDTKKTSSSSQVLDASNRFYTLIPHDFGLKKPPLLDNTEIIKSRIEMLDNLLEIEIAYSLIAAERDMDSDQDIFDVHYKNLKADLKVLDKDSEEFKRIKQYVKNTHGATHNQYSLDVLDVFTLDRHGESKVYKSFKDLNNRMLLWHGSRLTNFVGIISQGLRIAPPEAPATGYMFGKGIYFADMVSKSSNYCMTSMQNPIGLMLLSEVALGNMHELTSSQYIEKLPKGKHSTKGLGTTAPDPKDNFVCEDGVVIPMGEGKATDITHTSLLYNEYIVYDVAQVNLKYLLKLNFKYKK